MPLLNYTTTVPVAQTAAEILGILARIGAERASITYVGGVPSALEFLLAREAGDLHFRLPAREGEVLAILLREHGRSRAHTRTPDRDQAKRVAWRILKDWCEAQAAIIQVGMVRAEEVFLPYALTEGGQTMFERFVAQRALPAGPD